MTNKVKTPTPVEGPIYTVPDYYAHRDENEDFVWRSDQVLFLAPEPHDHRKDVKSKRKKYEGLWDALTPTPSEFAECLWDLESFVIEEDTGSGDDVYGGMWSTPITVEYDLASSSYGSATQGIRDRLRSIARPWMIKNGEIRAQLHQIHILGVSAREEPVLVVGLPEEMTTSNRVLLGDLVTAEDIAHPHVPGNMQNHDFNLRLWFDVQLTWTIKHEGNTALVSYPTSAVGFADDKESGFAPEED